MGISLVRDEVDVVALSVRHHLSLGLDHVLVLDNGSSDGTADALAELSRDPRVRWTRDDGAYRQVELRAGLVDDARRLGADWIVPFDADEFWASHTERLPHVLGESQADGLAAPVSNFVQRRAELVAGLRSLLTMTRRVAVPEGPLERTQERVESGEIAFVEMLYAPKVVLRARAGLTLGPGSHWVEEADAVVEDSAALACLHAPLRARSVLDAKAEHGRRVTAAGEPEWLGWHVRRWAELAETGGLEAEWAANSYAPDGRLDAGRRRPLLVEDRTLAELVRRLL